jgi:hypothetical protein
MTNPPDLATIVADAASRRGLRRRDDLREAGWTFWELRNLNMHRVVGLVKEDRAFAEGVLQWVILASADGRRAIGVHTWEAVFLSSVYRDVVAALTAGGYDVATAVKAKDGLLTFLTGVSEWEGVSFPEYRDRP